MEKMEQQGLSNRKIPKEYTPVVFNESLPDDTMDYQYGATKQQLRPWIEVEKSSWWWSPKIWSFTFSTTWNIVITWVWFKPSLVRFSVWDNSVWVGTGAMTSTSQFSVNYSAWSTYWIQCIYYGNPVRARCEYVSMDTDWFTINCIYYNPWLPTQVYYEAYP